MNKILLTLCALCTWTAGVLAAPLYALSGDDFGVPRRLNLIDAATSTVTPLFDLGDGSLGYTGLTVIGNRFYTVASDGFGPSVLHSFMLAGTGTTTPEFVLGAGFVGGIAAGSATQIYALANDFGGASGLYSIDLGSSSVTALDLALGFGLAGGLTFDGDDGLLYALGSDADFMQTLYSIDPAAAGSSTAVTPPLGMGIIGGLDHAPGSGFRAIGNALGYSELLSVSVGGGATPLFALASVPSYTWSALTSGPAYEPQPVPEPTMPWLLLGPVAWLLTAHRRRRQA